MINEVRGAFKKNLKNLKWMDRETREAAEKKADAITDMIGFPNYILNPQQLDEKYKDLEVRDYEYFENNIRVNQFNLKTNLETLDQPVNKTKYDKVDNVQTYYCLLYVTIIICYVSICFYFDCFLISICHKVTNKYNWAIYFLLLT